MTAAKFGNAEVGREVHDRRRLTHTLGRWQIQRREQAQEIRFKGRARNPEPQQSILYFFIFGVVFPGYTKPGYTLGRPDHPGPQVIHLKSLHHSK
jgi:hypothetical protein